MRRFTVPEVIDRTRQAVLSRLEALPLIHGWVLCGNERFIPRELGGRTPFARLHERLPIGIAARHADKRLAPVDDRSRAAADAALLGRFDLLGMDGLSFGRPVDWRVDLSSGHQTPLIHWRRIRTLPDVTAGDVKIVWELNRQRHLTALGRAFLQSGDERYAKALIDDIVGWIRANPPGFGINWVSSLELAFRCISWLWSLAMLRNWDKWEALPLLEIERSLYAQGRHIERYLSTYFSPNTHLTGEALGLYYMGTCLPEFRRANRWRELGRRILLQQLDIQVRADGVYFEQSTWYQRYTADFYTHFILLAERAGDPIPKHATEKLAALLDFLLWATRPDGTSPYIGDDDGGTLLQPEVPAPSDWRSVLSNGAVMLCRGDYKYVAGRCADETCWLFGPDAPQRFSAVSAAPPGTRSRAFTEGGFYVMRSGWDADANYLLVDCGPHGVMNCGHAHADALAVEVAANGRTILVDPGTFTYTGSPAERDLFRSTAMHNTVTIDGLSSSVPAGPFSWKHSARCALHCWHDHPNFTYFDGSHDGYRRLSDPATHTRSLFFVNREYWFLLDRIDAKGEHDCAAHFHLAPGLQAVIRGDGTLLEASDGSRALDIVYAEQTGKWHVADAWVSPCYGNKIVALHGTYSTRALGSVGLLSVLFPRYSDTPTPGVTSLQPHRGKALVVAIPRARDLLLWRACELAEEGVQRTDFEWVWLRRPAAGHPLQRGLLLHGAELSCDGIEIRTENPVQFVAFTVRDKQLLIEILPRVGVRVRAPRSVSTVIVNDVPYSLPDGAELDLDKQGLREPTGARDQISRCSHVRN